MQALQLASVTRLTTSRVALRQGAPKALAAPLRRSIAVRGSADQKPMAQAAQEQQQLATTAVLAAAGLLAPFVLDAEAAQAVPEILKGRIFSLIHPGENKVVGSGHGGVGGGAAAPGTALSNLSLTSHPAAICPHSCPWQA